VVDQEAPGLRWDGHVLLVHRSEEERRTGLSAWVRRGLERGDKVVYTEGRVAPAETLLAVLESRGVDGAAAVRDGSLAVLQPEEFFPAEGQRVVVERALAEGFASVRMAAETRAALSVLSPTAYWLVEQGMAELVRTMPVRLRELEADPEPRRPLQDDVVAVHLAGVRQATFTTDQDLDGLVLRGEIDLTNAEVFTAVLTAATRSPSRVLWLDLAEVTYVDAHGCRQLEDATQAFRAAGGHVLLVAPTPPVERILRLLECDELPGMHVLAGRR